jgi:hypothetical protein
MGIVIGISVFYAVNLITGSIYNIKENTQMSVCC